MNLPDLFSLPDHAAPPVAVISGRQLEDMRRAAAGAATLAQVLSAQLDELHARLVEQAPHMGSDALLPSGQVFGMADALMSLTTRLDGELAGIVTMAARRGLSPDARFAD